MASKKLVGDHLKTILNSRHSALGKLCAIVDACDYDLEHAKPRKDVEGTLLYIRQMASEAIERIHDSHEAGNEINKLFGD